LQVLSAIVKRGNAEVTFAQQSKALEAVKQFDKRTLDGVPMSVKLAPRTPAPASPQPAGNKAALFGSALGGQQQRATTFSIVVPGGGKGAKKDIKCNNCGKAGHLARDCRSAGGGGASKQPQAAATKPAEKKAAKPKAPPVSKADLDGEMDDYFKAAKPAEPTAE